jgi:uncharacterized repeat protein (TIGR01451 family)
VSIANPCDPKAKPTPVLPPKLYLAIRYSECETRPMRVHPLGCACDETLCEYSRIRDDFELTCLLDPPPKPPVLVCEICDVLMPACPPCPDNPWIVLAEITLPTATKTQTDVMKIPLADADINMLLRRQIFSTTVLQEQLLACCCQQPPASVAADLAVVKDGTVTDQTTLEYSINVTNNGPDHAESVVVTDSLPLGLKYDGIKSSQEWVATNQNMVLTATFAKMAVNETHTLKLIATGPLPDTNDSKDYLNTVEVKSSTSDSDLSNNKSSKTLTIFGPNLA